MSFFQNIKNQLAGLKIKSKLKKNTRKKEFHNLESSKSIGILFDTLQEKNHSVVKKFAEDLSQKGYKVQTVGWVNANELPDFGVAQKIVFYTNKDVKWSGEPIIPELIEFTNTKFDLLFVLTKSEHLSIKYITQVSLASCKVGSLTDNCEYLDLMIDQGKNNSIENLISESLKYLSQIKK
ncbi:DUF6913 domain-containing protein [Labilibaculum euxinus]|uniref:Uncharacterized protein n=1 Tax=Labilibaculum euxinus TaxID=2686357 RepID=A0A7M4D9L4_9BACT|nr:hypothetical protein [Labilibaculum euxinus]MUP39343.1 hypothetical protein [Labilibaculum euxinus]MVB08548.1 hypothetical protein [Labilibaculum euxinus]